MADDEGLEARLEAAMGTGDPETRRPVSLTEALYSRIVEVTRQEVSQTTEVLGELIIQMGRLDRRISDLTHRLESAPAPAASPDESPAAPPAPPLDVEALTRAFDGRLVEIKTAILTGQPDLSAVTDAVGRGLNDVRTAILTGQPDLAPINEALAELRQALTEVPDREPVEGGQPVDLTPVTAALAELQEKVGKEADFSPLTDVVTQWLADVRTTLSTRLDDLQRRLDQPADLTPVAEAISEKLASLEGSSNAHQAVHTSRLDDIAATIARAFTQVESRIDQLAAAPGADPLPDLTPALRALEATLDDLKVELADREQRLGQQLDRVEQSAAANVTPPELTALAGELPARLDALQAAITDRPDVAAVIRGAVAGNKDDVAAELENIKAAVAASGARFAARLDELRSQLSGDADSLASRLEASVAAAVDHHAPVDLTPLESGVREVTSRLDDLAARSDATQEALTTGLAQLAAGLPQAPDLSDVRGALDAVAQRVERLAQGVADDNEALAGRLDAARVELSGALSSVDPGPAVEAAVSSLTTRLADLEAAQRQSHEVVAARLDEVLHATHGTDVAPALGSLDAALAIISQRLESLEQATATSAPDLSAVTERVTTGLADTRDQLVATHQSLRSDMAGLSDAVARAAEQSTKGPAAIEALGSRLDAIESLVTSAQDDAAQAGRELADSHRVALGDVHGAVADVSERLAGITVSIDELRGSTSSTEVHDAKLDELRVLVTNLTDSVAEVNAKSGTEALGGVFDDHAAQALARLQEVTEGMLTRMERRDSQLASVRVDIEQAIGQSLARLQGDLTSVRDAVAGSEDQGNRRFEHFDTELQELGRQVGEITRLQHGLAQVSTGLEQLTATVSEQGRSGPSDEVVTALAALAKDLAATRERVLEVDRSVVSMKGDLTGSAEAAQASFQAADAVATLVQGVTRLESRLGIEVDDITRRLDGVAQALEALAQNQAHDGSPASRQKVVTGVSDRLIAIREVAAGVSEAVRNDARRRRERKAIESGHHRSE